MITRLSPEVVNRIAAGETISSEVNVIKELLENALDAKATRLEVRLLNGGKDRIEVNDNGEGILEADFPLLAERHCTSKLREYEELRRVDSMGFRGEALASVSYVSQLSVVSRH